MEEADDYYPIHAGCYEPFLLYGYLRGLERAFEDLFRRADLSVDWQEHYTTINDLCRRMAQRSFIDIYEKGHAYQTEAPTMWDPEFRTAVAQAEVEDREKEGAFYDIEFGVEGGGSFVVSTTRPELRQPI